MRLSRHHLDELAEVDLYGPNFLVSLNFIVLDQERKVQPEPWGKSFIIFDDFIFELHTFNYILLFGVGDGSASKNATVLFSSRTEINEVFDAFGEQNNEASTVRDSNTFQAEAIATLSNHDSFSDSTNPMMEPESPVEVKSLQLISKYSAKLQTCFYPVTDIKC